MAYDRCVLGDREVAALYASARDGDLPAFQHAVVDLWERVDETAEVLDRIVPLFAMVPPTVAGQLALGAVRRYRAGATAAGLVEAVAEGLRRMLTDAVEFAAAWRRLAGRDDPLPDPDGGQEPFEHAVRTLSRDRRWPRKSVSQHEAMRLSGGWFLLDDWVSAANGLLVLRAVRAELPHRDELTRLVRRLDALRPDMVCLAGLLDVLDDEPLIVVHRARQRAFLLTMSGVGDNFQLHTLIADTLSRHDLVEDITPEPDWVAAATTGPPGTSDRTRALFQLTDGDGMAIPIDGRPALIPPHRGRRVVVIDPPAYGRSWDLGRGYEDMVPEVRLAQVLGPQDAGSVAGPINQTGPRLSHAHYERRTGRVSLIYQA